MNARGYSPGRVELPSRRKACSSVELRRCGKNSAKLCSHHRLCAASEMSFPVQIDNTDALSAFQPSSKHSCQYLPIVSVFGQQRHLH